MEIMENKLDGENRLRSELKMYFSPDVADRFAEAEQNDKNFRVANIADKVIMQEIKNLDGAIYAAELGGGAHPDRYHKLFEKLLGAPKGHIDWVDVSPYMLKLAEKYISTAEYQSRKEVITYVESEILEYLKKLDDEKLNLAIMKYTIDHIKNLDELFELLSLKLKKGGRLVSTIGSTSPELKSFSTNARFLHNGEEFPDNETRTLKDGDTFTVKFFKVSGDPNSGYLEGAETVKHFHSAEKIKALAEKYGFEFYLGDWKGLVKENQEGETLDQEILVLRKSN